MPAHQYHGGLTPKEAQVMDLWDAGRSKERIVAETGFRPKYVDTVISMFAEFPEAGDPSSIRRASATFLAALHAAA